MSFLIANITLWSAVETPPVNGLPQLWGYLTTDALATVSAAGYFNVDPTTPIDNTFFNIGDLIYCVCSDGVVQLSITALTPNVTTSTTTVGANTVNTAAIQALAVTTAKIAANAVTLAKLASGITPSHVVKYGAQYTTVGGAATEAVTVTGALSTDIASCVIKDNGTGNVTLLQTAVTNDTLTLTFSGNPGNDAVVYYQIFRAAS